MNTIIIKLLPYIISGTTFISLFFYQNSRIKSLQDQSTILTAENEQLTSAVSEQKESISFLKNKVENNIRRSQDLMRKIKQEEENRRIIIDQLNEYKKNLKDAAINKPNLVENSINNAINNVLRDFEKATNNR